MRLYRVDYREILVFNPGRFCDEVFEAVPNVNRCYAVEKCDIIWQHAGS